MTVFETVFLILMTPALYVIAYLAGKYNLLAALCQLIAEKAEEFTKEDNDKCDPSTKTPSP